MKKKHTIQIPSHLVLAATMGLFLLVQPDIHAVELYTADTEEPELKKGLVEFEFGKVDFDEDDSNMALIRDQLGVKDSAQGGIRRFYWENDVSNDWRVYVDGRWLQNPDEFKVKYELSNGYNAFIDVNIDRWREYDFPGELYYPATDSFPVLSSEALSQEINKIQVSIRLLPGDSVNFRVKYSFFERSGEKLSTRYGDDFQYVIKGTPSRGIIPALYTGNERVHSLDFSLSKEEGVDRSGMRLHYQKSDVSRKHIVERSAERSSANRFTTEDTELDSDMFSLSGFHRWQLTDTTVGSIGVAYTRLDGDLTGNRIFGSDPEAQYDINFANRQLNDRGYLDLENKQRLKQWIVNANAVYTPSTNYRWMAGVRLEYLSTSASSSYLDTWEVVDWQRLRREDQEASALTSSKKEATDISAFLEGRYTGFKRIILYTRAEASAQEGDLDEDWSRQELAPDNDPMVSLLDRASGFDRQRAYWEVGVNYNPMRKLRLSVEGYTKYAEDDYEYGLINLPPGDYTLYPGYITNQVVQTNDINARIHCRLIPHLTSVTRIDAQNSTVDSRKDLGLIEYESAERERIVFNQSLVWTPHPRFYLSGTFNKVEDLTETGAVDLEGNFGGIIVNLPNDYWQTEFNLYAVLTKLIDAQLSYQYLEMEQFIDTSPKTVAYGTDLEQHHGMAQLIFHFSERLQARLGYHYYERQEPSAAGNKDFSVHMANGSLQIVF